MTGAGNNLLQVRAMTAADVPRALDLVTARQLSRQPWYARLLRRPGAQEGALRASLGAQITGAVRGDFGRCALVATVAGYDSRGDLQAANIVGVLVREADGRELLCEEMWEGAAAALRAHR